MLCAREDVISLFSVTVSARGNGRNRIRQSNGVELLLLGVLQVYHACLHTAEMLEHGIMPLLCERWKAVESGRKEMQCFG
jgi:hypothetical protein